MIKNSQKKAIKLHLKCILGVITVCMALSLIGLTYADEPIKVTISITLHNVQVDGGWTFTKEWKNTSYDELIFDDGHETGLYTWDYLYQLGQNQKSNWIDYLHALNKSGHKRKQDG